jgi:hypothetical protein
MRLLLTIGDIAPKLDGRPCGDLGRRLFPDYRGAAPAGVLPAVS